MIVKFSKKNFGPNFDPLPDGIFEKFQRIWKALWKYFRALAGQNSRFRPRKGSFWGSKLKKNFSTKNWLRVGQGDSPWRANRWLFSKKLFLQKIANSKLYFYTVVPSKNFNRSGNANKNRALGANFAPPPWGSHRVNSKKKLDILLPLLQNNIHTKNDDDSWRNAPSTTIYIISFIVSIDTIFDENHGIIWYHDLFFATLLNKKMKICIATFSCFI